ncbi:MAG TPA: 6-phosphogluconolactonase [Candidatus Sulfotelmatobacter sp.]|nr:6-phosphogluconolactonase [Candidatus Sulfotelmatobacter sp.]
MRMDSRVYPDLDALSLAAVREMQRIIEQAVAERGRFAIALSGGHTPARMYALWAEGAAGRTAWEKVHLFWGDERFVPLDDLLSNYRMTRETLIAHVPIPAANVHPVPTNLPYPAKAAEAYEIELRTFFGASPPQFDLQLLGLGIEGHVASLFPGSPALEEKNRWVMAVRAPAQPPDRITLTPAVLDQGLNTFFLVAGENKREILKALRSEPGSAPSNYPAGRIRPIGRALWFLDHAAGG